MREFPVFVPWGREHLAATLTLPDHPPRGLVVLSTGLVAPRSHRHQVWAVAAQRLAAAGFGSIRWEYPGLHDSTGWVPEVSTSAVPFDAVATVTRFALDATGEVPVLAVGNCGGADFALAQAAQMRGCLGAVCVLPEPLEPGRLNSAMRKAVGRRLRALFRSNPSLRRLAGPVRTLDMRLKAVMRRALPAALARGRVLFLYDQEHRQAGPTDLTKVEALLRRLPSRHRERFELRILGASGLDRFGSVENQELTVRAVVEWAEACVGAVSAAVPG